MKPYVYCKKETGGRLSFYLSYEKNGYFLFIQKYKSGVFKYFSSGVGLDRAIRGSLARRDFGILKAMEKLPAYIRYVEKEEGFYVLDDSIKKRAA